MDTLKLNNRMDELDRKMDMILEIVSHQKMKTEELNDLADDLAIVGKDIYDSAVEELDNQKIELQPEDLIELGTGFLRNIKNFNKAIALFESVNDFAKDAEPIVHDAILDLTKTLNQFDEKGYFDKLSELAKVIDLAVSQISVEDIKQLAGNIGILIELAKKLTSPELLKPANNALAVFESIQSQEIPEYSLFKMMRQLNKPEMKRAFGFAITFMKEMDKA